MRTLKKVLALTVVLATLLSISAFAAFSDEESIDESFVDAVNLLGALNVMTGDTEGTFRPNDTISRAEAAKMIYVIRNGGVDDQAAGWTGMSTFSDVASGVWFEGYVNYCASLGIIAGVGGGKFNPSGAVTGVELAKMMLVVADYNPNIEGYTGTGWNLNVIRDAQSAGMFEGYTLAYSAAATRQQAAQLFSNAILETEMAVYIGDVRLNSAAGIGNAQTVGERFFSLQSVTGYLTKLPHVDLPQNGGVATLNASDNEAVLKVKSGNATNYTDRNFVFTVEPELLGQEVEVIYKETSNGVVENNTDVLDNRDTVYDVMATGRSKVYETTMDAITLELQDTDAAFDKDDNPVTIKFEGYNSNRAKAFAAGGELDVITNLYEVSKVQNSLTNGAVTGADKLAIKSTAAVRFVDSEGDGNLDMAFVTTPIYGTVNTYNADRNDFSTTAKLNNRNITSSRNAANFENFTFEDDLVKDDVIAINIDVTSGEILYTVSLVEPVVGELTRVTANDKTITVGGTAYGFYEGEFNGTAPEAKVDNYGSGDLGKELTLYTDGKYIFQATDGTSGKLGTNFAFVQKISENRMTDFEDHITKVQLVLADGTTKVYDYKVPTTNPEKYVKSTDVIAKTGNVYDFVGRIVEYKASGDTVAFYVAPSKEVEGALYGAGTASDMEYNVTTGIFGSGKNAVLNGDESVYFLPSDEGNAANGNIDSVKVLKGSELKGKVVIDPNVWSSGNYGETMLISAPVSDVQTVAYAVLDPAQSSMAVTGTYLYTDSASYIDRTDSTNKTAVDGVLSDSTDAAVTPITLDGGSLLGNKLYEVTEISGNTYTVAEININDSETKMNLGAITARIPNRNSVQIDGAVYGTNDATKVFVVDVVEGDILVGDYSYLTVASKDGDNYLKNVLYEVDDENVLTVVYVEMAGESIVPIITYSEKDAITLDLPTPAVNQVIDLEDTDEYEFAVKLESVTPASGSGEDKFTVIPDNKIPDATKELRVTIKVTAKTGVMFSKDFKLDGITVPNGYGKTSINVSPDGNTLTVVLSIAAEDIISTVDAGNIDSLLPEFDQKELDDINNAPESGTTKELPVPESSPLVSKVEMTYDKAGAEGKLTKVEVTLTDKYKASFNSASDKDAMVKAIAEALGLNYDENLVEVAAMVLMAQSTTEGERVVSYSYADGVLTLTLGTEVPPEPIELTVTHITGEDEVVTPPGAILHRDAGHELQGEPGSYTVNKDGQFVEYLKLEGEGLADLDFSTITIERKRLVGGEEKGSETLTLTQSEDKWLVSSGDNASEEGRFGIKDGVVYLKLGTTFDVQGQYTNTLEFKDAEGNVVATGTSEPLDLSKATLADAGV